MKKMTTEYIIPDYIKNGNQITYNDKVYYEINRCLGYKPDMYFISLDGEICPTLMTSCNVYRIEGVYKQEYYVVENGIRCTILAGDTMTQKE